MQRKEGLLRRQTEKLDVSWRSVARRERGDYHHYTAETRAKIIKYALESGNKAAVKKYSVELGHPVSEGTVRNFKRKYFEELKSVTDPDLVTSLPSAVQFLLFRTNVMQ